MGFCFWLTWIVFIGLVSFLDVVGFCWNCQIWVVAACVENVKRHDRLGGVVIVGCLCNCLCYMLIRLVILDGEKSFLVCWSKLVKHVHD